MEEETFSSAEVEEERVPYDGLETWNVFEEAEIYPYEGETWACGAARALSFWVDSFCQERSYDAYL